MEQRQAPHDPDAYAMWIARRIGRVVRERREALGISAYALAKHARVTDQTILNIERGRNRPLLTTLARICVRFGMTLTDLVGAAERRANPPKTFG